MYVAPGFWGFPVRKEKKKKTFTVSYLVGLGAVCLDKTFLPWRKYEREKEKKKKMISILHFFFLDMRSYLHIIIHE